MIRATLKLYGVLAGALFASGCATDKVILLENEDDHPTGAVAVIASNGSESVIDRPLTQAKLRDGPTKGRALKKLKPKYGALLAGLPPSAKGFIITFPTGESTIPEDQRGVLQLIRNELANRPGAQIEVAGFTDSNGTEELNNTISKDRADIVAQELRNSGFAVGENDTVGRGEYEAREKLGDEVVDATYRRAIVIVR